jgi:hypothetical protein
MSHQRPRVGDILQLSELSIAQAITTTLILASLVFGSLAALATITLATAGPVVLTVEYVINIVQPVMAASSVTTATTIYIQYSAYFLVLIAAIFAATVATAVLFLPARIFTDGTITPDINLDIGMCEFKFRGFTLLSDFNLLFNWYDETGLGLSLRSEPEFASAFITTPIGQLYIDISPTFP